MEDDGWGAPHEDPPTGAREKAPPRLRRNRLPRHWRDRFAASTDLPPPANCRALVQIPGAIFLSGMNTTQNGDATTPGSSPKQEKAPIESLPKMEMYAVLGLELGKLIFERLQEVEATLEMIARQTARDLKQQKPDVESVA